jgi:hypothetical protein
MNLTKDYIEMFSGDLPENELYSRVLSLLAEDGFFQILEDGNCLEFHKKIWKLASIPHGVGLSLGIIAQVAITGNLLKVSHRNGSEFSGKLLEEIQSGKTSVSVGISEKGWKGRISNIKTNLSYQDGTFFLNGEKSFCTNGNNAKYFLVLAKGIDTNYALIAIPKDRKEIKLHPFSLSFAREATHCSLSIEQLEIKKEWILPLDYTNWGERLRINEMFSLTYLLNGFLHSIIPKIIKFAMEKEVWEGQSTNHSRIFDFWYHLESHLAYMEKISLQRQSDYLTYPLETHFPFGIQTLVPQFLESWEGIFTKSDLISMYPDLELFFYQDDLNHYFLKKATKAFFKSLFSN